MQYISISYTLFFNPVQQDPSFLTYFLISCVVNLLYPLKSEYKAAEDYISTTKMYTI